MIQPISAIVPLFAGNRTKKRERKATLRLDMRENHPGKRTRREQAIVDKIQEVTGVRTQFQQGDLYYFGDLGPVQENTIYHILTINDRTIDLSIPLGKALRRVKTVKDAENLSGALGIADSLHRKAKQTGVKIDILDIPGELAARGELVRLSFLRAALPLAKELGIKPGRILTSPSYRFQFPEEAREAGLGQNELMQDEIDRLRLLTEIKPLAAKLGRPFNPNIPAFNSLENVARELDTHERAVDYERREDLHFRMLAWMVQEGEKIPRELALRRARSATVS